MQELFSDTLPTREAVRLPDADGRGYNGDATRHGDHDVLDRFDDGIGGCDCDGVIHRGVS